VKWESTRLYLKTGRELRPFIVKTTYFFKRNYTKGKRASCPLLVEKHRNKFTSIPIQRRQWRTDNDENEKPRRGPPYVERYPIPFDRPES